MAGKGDGKGKTGRKIELIGTKVVRWKGAKSQASHNRTSPSCYSSSLKPAPLLHASLLSLPPRKKQWGGGRRQTPNLTALPEGSA